MFCQLRTLYKLRFSSDASFDLPGYRCTTRREAGIMLKIFTQFGHSVPAA